ncbi:MAG: site-specific integrase, partial [Rikenellaceae bacterium]
MAKIIYSLVYNRKGKLLKDGTAPVSVCAYLNAQRKYFATDIKLKPEQWDKRRQKIKATAPNYIQRNTYLSDFLATLERYELEQIEAGRSVTLDCLAEALNPKEDHSDFLAFFKKESANKKTITENTRRVYNSTYHHLTMFRSRILLDDLTYQFLHEFENYLLGKGINTNTAGKYLKTIKTVVNLAINYGYMDYNNYPFRNYVIRSQPTNRTYLDPKEIERIEALEIPAERVNLQIVKDMYLFAVYSGLRFSDIVRLSPDNIQVIEGKQYIVINMEKTKEPLRLPIFKLFNGKPLELLAKYTRPNRKFYFDDFTNQFVNRELKEIARLAGVDKVVTFHTA